MIFWQPGMTLESGEKMMIEAAYKYCNKNKTHTADTLKISVRTLDTKLEKYDAERVVEKSAAAAERARNEDYLKRSRGLPRTTSGVMLESATPAVAGHTLPVSKPEGISSLLSDESGADSSRPSRKRIKKAHAQG